MPATYTDEELQAMSVDELDAISVEYKREIQEIRDLRREAKMVRERKVLVSAVARELGVPEDSLTEEDIEAVVRIKSRTIETGGIRPGPANLEVNPGSAEVQ